MANFCQIVFCSLLLTTISAQNVIPPETQAQIDALVTTLMETEHVPAFALSITKNNGEILYNKGYGLRDREKNVTTDADTLFGIGSITKSFTAIVIVKYLSEQFPALGASVLDTPIRVLAPSYNFTLGDKYRSEKVTFKDLLAHRVCTLPEAVGMWVQAYEGEDDFYYRQRYAPELCGLRDGYLYNNGLIGMAGHIVAHMANSTYDEMLSNLLISIGMNSSTLIKHSDDHDNMPNRALPYIWKDNQLIRFNSELLKSVVFDNPAGGILSSANDMAKYMQFHLNRGKVGTTQVVSEEAMGWLRIPANPIFFGVLKTEQDPDAIIDAGVGYGLCVVVSVYDGYLRIWHNGYIPPFESELNTYPHLGLGIFSSSSGPGKLATETQTALHNAIFHILQNNGTSQTISLPVTALPKPDNQSVQLIETKLKNISEDKPQQIAPKISPEDAVGTFGSGFNGDLTISFKNNTAGAPQLHVEYGKWGLAWLNQTSPSTFALTEWDSDFWMMFWSSDQGVISQTLEFVDADTIRYLDHGQEATTLFKRGQKVGDLPVIPWEEETCKSKGVVEMGSLVSVIIVAIITNMLN